MERTLPGLPFAPGGGGGGGACTPKSLGLEGARERLGGPMPDGKVGTNVERGMGEWTGREVVRVPIRGGEETEGLAVPVPSAVEVAAAAAPDDGGGRPKEERGDRAERRGERAGDLAEDRAGDRAGDAAGERKGE